MKKGNVLILAIAATALLGGSAWLYAKKTGGHEEKKNVPADRCPVIPRG